MDFIKKTIFTIDYDDFDKFVESKYGGKLKFYERRFQDTKKYSSYTFNVPNMVMFFGNEAADIRQGKYTDHSIQKILKVLYEDGHIEQGEYIIKIN